VLPLVVIVGFQSAWAAFACRVDGKVRDHCCCKTEKNERKLPADEPSRVTARSCCDVTIHEASEAPLVREVDRATFAHVPVIIPSVMLAVATPRAERVALIPTMARPPPPRVPLFIDKHAILR
jgi:hypothetical protein